MCLWAMGGLKAWPTGCALRCRGAKPCGHGLQQASCSRAVREEASFLPSSSSCAPWGSSVRADVVSGHGALHADQALDVPASPRWGWDARELGSDPLPGAGGAFRCPTGSRDLWCSCCKRLLVLMKQGMAGLGSCAL